MGHNPSLWGECSVNPLTQSPPKYTAQTTQGGRQAHMLCTFVTNLCCVIKQQRVSRACGCLSWICLIKSCKWHGGGGRRAKWGAKNWWNHGCFSCEDGCLKKIKLSNAVLLKQPRPLFKGSNESGDENKLAWAWFFFFFFFFFCRLSDCL